MARSPVLLSACVLCAACADDETVTLLVGPTGPPSVRFADPESGTIGCRSVGEDAATQVPLLVEVREFILRPPGACTNLTQCGHLALYAEGVLNNESSVPAIDLLVYKLADPYHNGLDTAAGEADLLEVRVDVLGDDGQVIRVDKLGMVTTDPKGEPLDDEVSLRTVANCPGND